MFLKLFLVGLLLATTTHGLKLPVTVYYESLCPDSAAFINQQLTPAVKELLSYIDLKLIPFGKSNYTVKDEDVEFNCHHGPNECHGNKVHACAIELIRKDPHCQSEICESILMEYIDCLMSHHNDDVYPTERCGMEVDYKDWIALRDCASSNEGSRLLKFFGDETAKFQSPLAGVPSIVFNGQFDSDLQKRSLVNFRETICDVLLKDGVKAEKCDAK